MPGPNLAIIYGTRPEYLKLIPLIHKLRAINYPLKVIRVGQHNSIFDGETFDEFIAIEESQLAHNRVTDIASQIFAKLPTVLTDCKEVLVQGDTATVAFSAQVAHILRKRIIHLEAGMRTYNLANPFPEEGFRQMVSRIADVHLCPHEENAAILTAERVQGKIYVVGNTILDLVRSYEIPVTTENVVLITLHRRENWSEFEAWLRELYALAHRHRNYAFIFLAHMNPHLQAMIGDIDSELPHNFTISPPMSHRECVEELSRCAAVITDSGGIQEEANFLGKFIYVPRKQTERSAIPSDRLQLLLRPADLRQVRLPANAQQLQGAPNYTYGHGNSCERICSILASLNGAE
jgi:UDP-N-acetylglucosamine 2-epimerase (non-hydrolysing)